MSAKLGYEKIVKYLSDTYDGVAGQMFGKKRIKINNKAGVALYQDCLVFKLPGEKHAEAIALSDSIL